MTYTVEEQSSAYNQVERIVSYYDVNLNLGDQFIGTVTENPSTEAEYPLFKKISEGQEELVPSVDQDKNAVEKFDVTLNVIGNGTAVGAGTYVNGQFVQATAVADENEGFVGWYKDQVLLSESTEYRFLVDGDITITAKFTSNQEIPDEDPLPAPTPDPDVNDSGSSDNGDYLIAVDQGSGGRVTVQPGRADKGDTVTITVHPDDGYELDELVVTDNAGDEISVRDRGDGRYTFTMPRGRVTVEATFVEIMEEPEALPFVDVPTDAYYYDAVTWAVENGVTGGTSATTFSPDNACTRAQVVTFLWRAAGSPAPETAVNPFTDVSANAYYYEAVLWAVENGITSGTSATTFSPDATVTRSQTVTFLWRNAGSPAVAETSFADVATDAYYATAVAWAAREGITSGTSATTFSPDNACTRAQIVTFLYRDLAE